MLIEIFLCYIKHNITKKQNHIITQELNLHYILTLFIDLFYNKSEYSIKC